MASKRGKVSRESSSMADILSEQEEHSESPFVPRLSKKHKVSWPSDSMEEVVGELKETATSPFQTRQLNHDIAGSTSKKKRGPTKCLKTNGIRYEDHLKVRLNVYGKPVGPSRAKLSTYLGTLARNVHLAPLTYTSWKGLKAKWDDMWKILNSKFDIEEDARKWVLQTLCSCWRTHKCRLKKKYFKSKMTEDYNIKNPPPNIPLEHWKFLLNFGNLIWLRHVVRRT